MVKMENAEEVMQILERFTRLKQKEIPKELEDYLQYVAKTGDTMFNWSSLKYFFREKLLNVMKHFYDTSPRVDEIPQYPNVDPFNYESMKSSLLERLELFNAAPFTIQRLCELLIDPRKQYSRIDKFMRALEKNILVSTIEPGRKRTESENGDSLDSVVNGDLSLDVNVDIDMENESLFNIEAQNGNSNGTATAAAESTAKEINSTTENEPKEKLPVKEPSKHTITDDEVLPNAKKAKLEIEEDEDENHKTTEDVVAKDGLSEAKTETTDIKPQNEVKVAEKEEDIVVETKSTKQTVDEPDMQEGSKEVELKEVQETNKTLKEQEEKEVEAKLEITNIEVEKKQIQVERADEETDKKESAEEVNETKGSSDNQKEKSSEVDSCSKSDSKKETDSAKLNEDQDKIIEKQEIEKGEKEEVVTASTDDKIKKSDVVDEAMGNKIVENVSAEDQISEDASKTETTVESAPAKVNVSINEDTTENNEEVTTKTADTASKVENGPKDTEAGKDALNEVVNGAENTKDEKTDVDNDSEDATPAEKVEAKPTETEVAAAGEEVASVTEKEPVTELKADDEPLVENAAAVETSPEVQPAEATITADNEAAAVEVGADATPTIALNDHPMDDVPIEDSLPAIDEVVMAETGGAIEMATDANEPVKDEPAGMEVDDTSQEAMDQ